MPDTRITCDACTEAFLPDAMTPCIDVMTGAEIALCEDCFFALKATGEIREKPRVCG